MLFTCCQQTSTHTFTKVTVIHKVVISSSDGLLVWWINTSSCSEMTVNCSYLPCLVEPHTAQRLFPLIRHFKIGGVTALKRSSIELLLHSGKLEEFLPVHEAISPPYLAAQVINATSCSSHTFWPSSYTQTQHSLILYDCILPHRLYL